jgi:hypothetical protein
MMQSSLPMAIKRGIEPVPEEGFQVEAGFAISPTVNAEALLMPQKAHQDGGGGVAEQRGLAALSRAGSGGGEWKEGMPSPARAAGGLTNAIAAATSNNALLERTAPADRPQPGTSAMRDFFVLPWNSIYFNASYGNVPWPVRHPTQPFVSSRTLHCMGLRPRDGCMSVRTHAYWCHIGCRERNPSPCPASSAHPPTQSSDATWHSGGSLELSHHAHTTASDRALATATAVSARAGCTRHVRSTVSSSQGGWVGGRAWEKPLPAHRDQLQIAAARRGCAYTGRPIRWC